MALQGRNGHKGLWPHQGPALDGELGDQTKRPMETESSMTSGDANRHYQGDAGKHYHDSKRAVPPAAFAWVARLRSEKLAHYVKGTDTVFEYGVGFGWNLALLRCQRKIGFDKAEFLETGLRERGIEFVRGINSIPASSIDILICHHTLEHTLHPPTALAEMRHLLRPGGKLLLFVPFEKEGRYRRFNPTEPNHHLYSWNVQTLGNLVEEMGFTVIEGRIGQFGYDRFAATWADRWHLGETGFRLVREAVHLIRPGLEVRLVATIFT
jgi:SAM-dependent methyltransferase